MDTAQDKMRDEYFASIAPMLIDNDSLKFKSKLKLAAEQGLLLFIKYFLLAVLGFFAVNYLTQLNQGSINGTNSSIYLNELISKGYLPKAINGQIPAKEIENAK